MKQKAMVTYIKNGIETTATLNIFNKRKILKKIYTEYNFGNSDIYYSLKKDIDFVHFKNFSFRNVRRITTPHDTMCILENCTFEKNGYSSYAITLAEGSLELISPKFKGKRFEIDLCDLENFNIINTRKRNKSCKIMIETMTPTKEKVTINDNDYIDSLNIKANTIYINNELCVKKLRLNADKIFIGNNNTSTTVNFKLSSFPSLIEADEEIHLTNCTINNIENPFRTKFEAPKIFVKNISLNAESATTIYINDNKYYNSFGTPEIQVTDHSLATSNLISLLKGYKEKIISENIEQKKETYLKETYKQRDAKQKQLEEQLKQVKKQQQELANQERSLESEMYDLNNDLENKDEAIVRSLSKKTIKQLVK